MAETCREGEGERERVVVITTSSLSLTYYYLRLNYMDLHSQFRPDSEVQIVGR